MGQTIKDEQIVYLLCEKVAGGNGQDIFTLGGEKVKVLSYLPEGKNNFKTLVDIAQLKSYLLARVKMTQKNIQSCELLEWVQLPANKTHAQS